MSFHFVSNPPSFLTSKTHELLALCLPVNTASRMESNSKANRIHCSAISAEILSKQAPTIPLRSRGAIPIKGKGNIHTYWVNEEGSKSASFQKDDVQNSMMDWARPKRRSSSKPKRKSFMNTKNAKSTRKSMANTLLRPLDLFKEKDNRETKSSEFSLIRESRNSHHSNHSRSISIHSVDLEKVAEQFASDDSSSLGQSRD